MNLRSWTNKVADAGNRAAAAGIFRQFRRSGLFSPTRMTPFSDRVKIVPACLVLAGLLALVFPAAAQTNYYAPNGTEYAVIGALPGDQMFPDAAISTTGGFMVWQDNATDGSGWGVSARRLDATLSGTLGTFRVNATGAGNQENPRVALLKNQGAAFVWQGGVSGLSQHIYTRFLTPTNTFLTTNDVLVSTPTNNFQVNPALAVLNNSNVVVVWSSYNQAGSNSMLDVYGQILSPAGQKVGGEFLVNQFTNFNQRTPTVVALTNGGFVVGWVSEQQRVVAPVLGTNSALMSASAITVPSVDIYARLFKSNGVASGAEFLVDTAQAPCANPVVAAAKDGGFLFVWGQRDTANPASGWDIYARSFSGAAVGGAVVPVNTWTYGDQFNPRVNVIGLDYLVTWTSLGQDGSREGVFGQFLHNDGSAVGGEFRVNTTTASQQMQAAVASDGANQFLAVWTSFTGQPNNFDLRAQRYINAAAILQPMSAPFVWVPFVTSNNVYQPRLVVSWAALAGLSVSNFEVYVDGANTPAATVTGNQWIMTAANGLNAGATHSFQVDYVLTDGRQSPKSPSASATAWQGLSWGGIPFEWMTQYYGSDISQWPAAGSKLGDNGPTMNQVFLSGGSPLDSSTWLHQQLSKTPQGMFLNWNTQPGATYQVQATTNFTSWSNVGSPRFAAGGTDSIYVGGNSVGYYRVMLLR